jgi:hypothetical protein
MPATATPEAPAPPEPTPKVTFWEGAPTREQRDPAKVTEEILVERRKRVSGTGTVTSVVLIPAKEGEELAPFRARCEHGKSDRKRHSKWSSALASAKASQDWCEKCAASKAEKEGTSQPEPQSDGDGQGEPEGSSDEAQAEEPQAEPTAA